MPKLKRRDNGEEVPLADGVTRIGRRSANDIQLNRKYVSRHHCSIHGPAGGWEIADVGSKLGTFVNGRRVRRRRLHAGDEIKIGAVVFIFEEGGPVGDATAHPHLDALTDSAAVRVLPRDEPGTDEDEAPAEGVASRRRRVLPVALGIAVAGLAVIALATTLWATRRTPEKAVRRAAELLRERDGAALWRLVSGERQLLMTEAEFREQVAALPDDAIAALDTLELGEARRGTRGMVVPVALTVAEERIEDEVVLYREDGRWRIYAAPVERILELTR
jgi:hypothetical protein